MQLAHAYYAKSLWSLLLASFQTVSGITGAEIPEPPQAEPIPVVQMAPKSFETENFRLAGLERKRLMYDARANALIITHEVASGRQEVPMGPKLV